MIMCDQCEDGNVESRCTRPWLSNPAEQMFETVRGCCSLVILHALLLHAIRHCVRQLRRTGNALA